LKNKISILLIIFFASQVAYGQADIGIDQWEKIIIGDSYGGWFYFNNKYQIKRDGLLLTKVEKPDSVIREINPKLITELIQLLKNDSIEKSSPLDWFGKDSSWLDSLSAELSFKYKNDGKKKNIADSLLGSKIRDIDKANRVALAMVGSNRTDDYPYIYVKFIVNKDTLTFSSAGQEPYMLPWSSNEKVIYNYRISKIIADLLPRKKKSNKKRLSGDDFTNRFIQKFYRYYCEKESKYIEAHEKYQKSFKYLAKHFEVKEAEIAYMHSIEWGGNLLSASCLEMTLVDTNISENIEFYTIFGTNNLLNSPKTIGKKKDKLIKLLLANPIYNYTLGCEDCIGKIHWVNSKSLSKQAKNAFKEDLVENGINQNKYRGKFKNAIFYELTESRDSKSSFSRWIFLADGTIILWQIDGNYLMNLPKSITSNQGYVCTEIDPNLFVDSK